MESIQQIQERRFYKSNEAKASNNNSIELPSEIESLITGNDYWRLAKQNRYKKLIREGSQSTLMELAEMAKTKENSANWFAKVASKAQWDRTLAFLEKLHQVQKDASEVARRIGAAPSQMRVVFKACWRLNSVAIQRAITAQETGRDRFKYFCWLSQYKVLPITQKNPGSKAL